jgi:four helix bundle protein
VKTHKDLDAWKLSVDFVVDIYCVTKSFPKDEIYGITNQIRRASVSIPSNIAEGAARASNKEYAHFLSIALGSTAEVETQLIICKKLGYMPKEKFICLIGKIVKIRKLILGLRNYVDERK